MRARRESQAGFTYLGLLFAVVIMGLMLTAVSRVWSVTEQRERETQLLFVGDAIRMAISGYYAHGHRYPQSLQDLLADDRTPTPMRYLRRLYFDPMTGTADWTLILAPGDSGIMGVASKSTLTPIKRKGFTLIDAGFEDSDCYCSWQFLYVPRGFRQRTAPATSKP